MEVRSFEDLALKPAVLTAIRGMGFQAPTEVQAKAIKPALAGRDLLVQSRTGSGKTAAFGIPFAQGLVDPQQNAVQALVLAPTRELAIQVADECGRIMAGGEIRVAPIYGGAAMGPQISALRDGAQIVVGTPGRVLDHIRRGNLQTDAIRVLVLDECDEMLSMGFLEDISAILESLPKQRQTMLFSATIPDDIQRITERYLHDPVRLHLSEDFVGVREIQHIYYLISGSDRPGDLLRVLAYENPTLALIFCNTRDDTSMVAEFLQHHGFAAEAISSDLTQAERERVMHKMRAGELRFLVATDIAARGIDLSDLTHVINYTFPDSADVYVHRTGRTGRAGKSGIAISLVAPREIGSFYYLKLIHKIFPEERHLPSSEELATRREGERYERLMALCAGLQASEEMRGLARRVWSSVDGERLVGLALARVLDELKEIHPLRTAEPSRPAARGAAEEERAQRGREPRRDRGERRGRPGEPEEAAERETEAGVGPRPRRGRGGRPERGERGERRESRHAREGGARPPSRGARPAREGVSPRERKTTRTRRKDTDPEYSFTMPDGEVEQWEFVEPGDLPRAEERPETGAVRLFVNIGKRQGLSAEELSEFVLRETSAQGGQIEVQLRDTHSYLSVPAEAADSIISALAGKSLKERALRVERAKR